MKSKLLEFYVCTVKKSPSKIKMSITLGWKNVHQINDSEHLKPWLKAEPWDFTKGHSFLSIKIFADWLVIEPVGKRSVSYLKREAAWTGKEENKRTHDSILKFKKSGGENLLRSIPGKREFSSPKLEFSCQYLGSRFQPLNSVL